MQPASLIAFSNNNKNNEQRGFKMGVSITDMVTGETYEDSSEAPYEIGRRPTAEDHEISRAPRPAKPDMGEAFGSVTPGLQEVEIGQKPGITKRDHQMPPPSSGNVERHYVPIPR